MNERIRELVEQAIVDVDVVYEDNPLNEELAKMYIPDCFAEKFAELIAQECATICEEIAGMAEITNTGDTARKTKATAISCSNFIKNRFGVKS